MVILDIRMPGMDGIETLKEIKAQHPLVEVILLTGHGSTETAVDGMKSGAFDYLMKPADFERYYRPRSPLRPASAKQNRRKESGRLRCRLLLQTQRRYLKPS